MSFDTYLEIFLPDGEQPDLEALRPAILKQLDADGIHHDVCAAIEEAFNTSRARFSVHPAYLLQLMDELAPWFPETPFDARGLGEEFRETWVAEYRDGERVYTSG